VALLALILLSVRYTRAEPPLPNNPRPLVGASMDEVEKYAIEWAKAELRVTSEQWWSWHGMSDWTNFLNWA